MAGIGVEVETNKGSACIRNGGCQEEVKEKKNHQRKYVNVWGRC